MKAKGFYGKELDIDRITQYAHYYLPDDYETPCYQVIINIEGHYEPSEPCFYSLMIFVDDENRIVSIERDMDIYVTSYRRTRFPNIIEKLAEQILLELSR